MNRYCRTCRLTTTWSRSGLIWSCDQCHTPHHPAPCGKCGSHDVVLYASKRQACRECARRWHRERYESRDTSGVAAHRLARAACAEFTSRDDYLAVQVVIDHRLGRPW